MKMPKQLIKIITFCSLALFLAALMNKNFDDKNYNVKLQIINNHSKHNGKNIGRNTDFLVRIAKTDKEREQGLMWIKNLPKNYGMIFEFDDEQMIYMWMKNTKIPLDMIFIDKNNKITNIKNQAQPESLDIISSMNPAIKVLEINGGLAEKLGIEIGDLVKLNN